MKYLLILFLFASCAPSKYEAISVQKGTPPITTQDSNYLAGRCVSTFPVRDNATPVVLPTVPDSSDYYKAISDSLVSLKPTVIERLKIQYKDTCTSVVDKYNDGFDLGYKMGGYEAKSAAENKFKILLDKKDADCNTELNKALQADAYLIGQWRTANTLLQQDTATYRAKIIKLQGKVSAKNKELWFWRIIAIILIAWQAWKFYRRLTTIKLR